jgi:hypothetical protein
VLILASAVQISPPHSGMLSHPSQLQAMRQRDMNCMTKQGENMNVNEERQFARSKADFFRLAGIGPELVEFVAEFIEKPENYYSMPFEKRRVIENQMDAIIASFEQ